MEVIAGEEKLTRNQVIISYVTAALVQNRLGVKKLISIKL
jgi:hypothetical protein